MIVNTGKPGGTFKFTSKYQDVPIHPLYPFGFGLSYTEFSYENLQIQTPVLHPDGELQCTVTIKNTGAYFGEEVVQLYIRDEKASCVRPVRELKGYQKIGLYPYEEKTCTFRVPVQNMGFYDRECRYVVEPGIFTVFVGPDSTKGLSGDSRYWKYRRGGRQYVSCNQTWPGVAGHRGQPSRRTEAV